MTTLYDYDFKNIGGLKWLPFVGDNYPTLPLEQKLVLIGESHYYEPTEGEGSLQKHQDENFTRKVIQDVAIGREYRTYKNRAAKLFPNVHFTFFGNDSFDSKLLWDNVCFYNFIQRPMNTKGGRPTDSDWKEGWRVFQGVISIVKPSVCIFLGNSSSKVFQSALSSSSVAEPLTDDGWINNSASRKATVSLLDGHLVKLKFIKHPSRFYSWRQWNAHLKERQLNCIAS